MTLETLLANLEGPGAVTPVTPAKSDGVTANPAPLLACTPVTPVTPQTDNIAPLPRNDSPATIWRPDTILSGWWLEYTPAGELVSSANHPPADAISLPASVTCATCQHYQAGEQGGIGTCTKGEDQRTAPPSERYPAGHPVQAALYPHARRICTAWEAP